MCVIRRRERQRHIVGPNHRMFPYRIISFHSVELQVNVRKSPPRVVVLQAACLVEWFVPLRLA